MATIWTPETARRTVPVSAEEMYVVAAMSDIAQRYGLAFVCEQCQQAFQGTNAETDAEYAITCGCRELRGPNPRRRRA